MYVCMYECMYVRMYVCVYVCMYVCMYVCILNNHYKFNGRIYYDYFIFDLILQTLTSNIGPYKRLITVLWNILKSFPIFFSLAFV